MKLNINYYLRSPQINERQTIYLFIGHAGKRRRISMREHVAPSEWDKVSQNTIEKSGRADLALINEKIKEVTKGIRKYFQSREWDSDTVLSYMEKHALKLIGRANNIAISTPRRKINKRRPLMHLSIADLGAIVVYADSCVDIGCSDSEYWEDVSDFASGELAFRIDKLLYPLMYPEVKADRKPGRDHLALMLGEE